MAASMMYGAVLFVAVEGRRPLAGSSRHVLRGLDRVTIGHAAARCWQRGRSAELHTLAIGVPDPKMVADHARLIASAGAWWVERVAAEIAVNGIRVAAARLADGDLLTIGGTVLLFRERGVRMVAGAVLDHDAEATPRLAAGLETFCPGLAHALDDLAQLAPSATPIVLHGETGTGKELAARAVHALSRRSGPFIAVNCGALPSTLLESEMFGFRRGAFSGATADHVGLIRSADGGTLFLDEIAELPPPAQAALLRVLQEREVVPLGATRPIPVDLKLVCATHRDLRAASERGEFRSDLYARLAGFVLRLPALRERREDLGSLIAAILGRMAPRAGGVQLTVAAIHALFAHRWPHNIRELDTALGVAVALARGGAIDVEHLPEAMRTARPSSPHARRPDDAARKTQLEALLRAHAGNISAIARVTRRSRMQVHRWLKRYQLSPCDFRS